MIDKQLTTPPLAGSVSSGLRGAGFSALPVDPTDAEALAAWLDRPRLPTHPRTPLERGEAGELPWLAQREHDRAVDRACSPYAVAELLEERDLRADADAARAARLGTPSDTRWRS